MQEFDGNAKMYKQIGHTYIAPMTLIEKIAPVQEDPLVVPDFGIQHDGIHSAEGGQLQRAPRTGDGHLACETQASARWGDRGSGQKPHVITFTSGPSLWGMPPYRR